MVDPFDLDTWEETAGRTAIIGVMCPHCVKSFERNHLKSTGFFICPDCGTLSNWRYVETPWGNAVETTVQVQPQKIN
jgi:hypothetical protein